MGVFDDKKFEELDWISQATEPIDSQLNDVLAKLPDELTIDFNLFKEMLASNHSLNLSIGTVLSFVAAKHNVYLPWRQQGILRPLFKLEIIGHDVNIDFEKETITGEIRLVKLASTMDEKVLESVLGTEGIDAVSSMSMYPDSLSRANDILELLGKANEGLRTKSTHKKRVFLTRRLKELFKTNEWKIKDTELANKVGFWIKNYVAEGDAAAYANFCRLKVMTHKDQPIYSMEEVR